MLRYLWGAMKSTCMGLPWERMRTRGNDERSENAQWMLCESVRVCECECWHVCLHVLVGLCECVFVCKHRAELTPAGAGVCVRAARRSLRGRILCNRSGVQQRPVSLRAWIISWTHAQICIARQSRHFKTPHLFSTPFPSPSLLKQHSAVQSHLQKWLRNVIRPKYNATL